LNNVQKTKEFDILNILTQIDLETMQTSTHLTCVDNVIDLKNTSDGFGGEGECANRD